MSKGKSSQRGPESSNEPRTNVFVKFSGSIENLVRLGLEAPTVVDDPVDGLFIAAGSIPTDKLEQLGREPNVTRVEQGQRLKVKLNQSVAAIHADTLRQRTPPVAGNGVLIGVVDTGVDYRHRNFRTGPNSANSRIVRIWDQTLTAQGTETPPTGFNFGVEYTREQIQTALQRTTPNNPNTPATAAPFDLVRSGRPGSSSHGTHVAGIAAGNGTEPGNCAPLSTFSGVAPQAELIVVVPEYEDDPDYDQGHVQLFDSVHLANGVAYVFQVASDPQVGQGRPVVVNISLGAELGPHDGDTLLESLLDALVTQNVNGTIVGRPGRAIAAAAGNEADEALHATVDIAPGATEELVFRVPDVPANKVIPASLGPTVTGGYRRPERIDVYHDGGAAIEVSITPPGTPSRTFGPVRSGGQDRFDLNTSLDMHLLSRVRITSTINHIQIHLLHATVAELGGPLRRNRGSFPAGAWRIRLKSNAVSETITAHGWLEGHDRPTKEGEPAEVDEKPPAIPYWQLSFRFPGETGPLASVLTPSDEDWSINSPASAKQVIAVGAYSHPRFLFSKPEIARWSGRGRLFEGTDPVPEGAQKPDIVAPGVAIKSTRSGAIDQATKAFAFRWCSRCCYDFYVQKQGTSMATPHVVGVIALMFQVNPTLDALTVRQILRETADEPELTPALEFPNNIWGYGIVNATDAVDRAIELLGAGSGAGKGAPSASGGKAAPSASPLLAGRGGSAARRARPRMRRPDRFPSDRLIPADFLRSLRLPESSLTTLLVSRHFSEVRRIIDTNPRVATLWHRCRGPSFVRRTLGALHEGPNENYVEPSSGVREPTRQERRWRSFLAAVSQQSGVGLRADLERFGPHLLALLRAADPSTSRATSTTMIGRE